MNISGFNNLTKVLSFNLYDFCLAISPEQRKEYVQWIHQKYNSQKIFEVAKKICEIINANILGSSLQDYDPVGASTLVLMSDIKGGGDTWKKHQLTSSSGPNTTSLNLHLDKSHITAHTYPDAEDPHGVCSFRVDLDIATCGEIIPLDAINVLFESFECDVVVADYVVRGFTRLADGTKIFNDHATFNSIQDFIRKDILEQFSAISDYNMSQLNTWQTKMMIKELPPERYLMNLDDRSHPEIKQKMLRLRQEMRDVYEMLI